MTLPAITTVILLSVLAAAGYALFLLTSPTRTCPRCDGTRIDKRRRHIRRRIRRRIRACRRCRSTGRTRRIGATTVHRLYWHTIGDQTRQRRREQLQQARDRTDHPQP
ncbi:MAG: hypothetical protein GEV03_22190 [Streptosporangiales bacterium]|nr:hypothetical protein [Streptosporangiales bacterium]